MNFFRPVRRFQHVLSGCLALALLVSPALAAAQVTPVFATPQAMLLSYYSLINVKAYAQAYSDWSAPSQTYADFASGYLTTNRVLPYFGDWQPAPANAPANENGSVPAVLYGYRSDDSLAAYSGCFFLQAGNDSSNASTWKIVSANFRPYSSAAFFPNDTALNAALTVNCFAASSSAPATASGSAATMPVVSITADKGQSTLIHYYSLINGHNYPAAYAQWLQPLPGPKPNGAPAQDYRLPYADFVAGYADTVYAFAYLGAFDEQGASAGHGYLDGFIPAVLIGAHSDGSVAAYRGCYVLGLLPDGQLGIVSGTFQPIPAPYTLNGSSISNYLHVNCTTLSLQL